MSVNKEILNAYIIKVFGDIPGFDVKGLNDEHEVISSLFNNAQMINENFNSPINMKDVVDSKEINAALKEMAIKCGRTSNDKSQVSFLQLYLARIYMNIKRLSKIEYTEGLTENNLKDHAISASVSVDAGGLVKPRLNFSKDDERLNTYKGYNALPENLKQLFRRELRKKVLSHELSHASVCSKDHLGTLESFEEMLVERLALNSQNITRTLTREEYSYGYSKNSPNPESSNYRIYAAGEILSKIIGEEKLQTARLLGKKSFCQLIEEELKTKATNLNTYLDAAADKQVAHKYFKCQTPEQSRIVAQIKVESFLVSKFKEKKMNNLQNTNNLNENEICQLYRDCADIRHVLLLDKNNVNQMQSVIDLKEIISRLDQICEEKGIDYERIKEDIRKQIQQEDAHYIKQNNIIRKTSLE